MIATATVFFRRFYVKNSYCETDPFIVIAACCYVAAKAEESPVHIKNVVSEARMLFGSEFLFYTPTARLTCNANRRRTWHKVLSFRQLQTSRDGVLPR